MNEQQLLAQLKDIQTPEPVSFWPLAWGWWGVIVLTLLAFTAAIWWWRKRRRFNAPRRQALNELKNISVEADNWPSQINQLLKRTAISYFPASTLAGLYGQRWTQFMLMQLKSGQQSQAADELGHLQAMLYQPVKPDKSQFSRCQQVAAHWIKNAKFKTQPDPAGLSESEVSHV